jgi:cyclopropane-fatty-acyl-phospholipid synthase
MNIDRLLENNLLPDQLIRFGIRRVTRARLREEKKESPEAQQKHLMQLIANLRQSPIAVNTPDANAQHYEVPTDFFRLVLGPHMKYSCCYWTTNTPDLGSAEEAMLQLTCERAELNDGQDILELGCGWGSLTLFMAARYPNSRITAVSNSKTQKIYIDEQAKIRGLRNVTVMTEDMNSFHIDSTFDRVISIEMFEHMRNYERLLRNIERCLKDDGKLFVHIFTHKEFSYLFEVNGETDWMSKYFFTGGIMPGDHLLLYFNDALRVEQHWRLSGTHYERTAEAWLTNMDEHRAEIVPILASTYGKDQAPKWWTYWRVFFMACAELWGSFSGEEWFVSHYLFTKTGTAKR